MALRIDIKHLRAAGVDDTTLRKAVQIAEKEAAETNRANTLRRQREFRSRKKQQERIGPIKK